MKIINCSSKNNLKKLVNILYSRRDEKIKNSKVIDKILQNIKKNKYKALLKYEMKFSKNKEINISKNKINKSIKSLDPKVKKAIDYA